MELIHKQKREDVELENEERKSELSKNIGKALMRMIMNKKDDQSQQ